MKVYTLQEHDYSELEDTLECIMAKAKKFLAKMEEGEFGSRKRHWDEEDEYDWKIKKGYRY